MGETWNHQLDQMDLIVFPAEEVQKYMEIGTGSYKDGLNNGKGAE